MKYETIFWDWNGTIIDDLQASLDSVNGLFVKRNMKSFETPEDYFKVFCFPIVEYYKKAGFDFSIEPYEKLAVEYVDNYNRLSKSCRVFPDIKNALKKLHEKGVRQIILSASERAGLVEWLAALDILKYFDDVIGNDNIYAVGKADIALNWLDAHEEIDISRALLIGDTTHDFEVAEAMCCDCALVARGHNSRSDLAATGSPVFSDGKELYDHIIKQL